MSNLTGQFNGFLHVRNPGAVCGGAYSLAHINEFLREAYQINSRVGELIGFLRSIRQPYLSTAAPPRQRHPGQDPSRVVAKQQQQQNHLTDAQRDTIDSEAKSTLRDLHAAVNNLAQAEAIRHDAEQALVQKRRRKRNFGGLGQWASGGGIQQLSPEDELEAAKVVTIKAHREAVIWFLQRRLEECGRVQSTMMETRISRELEKSKSVLHKTGGSVSAAAAAWDTERGGKSAGQGPSGMTLDELDSYAAGEQALSEEQMQLFAQENRDMLKHYQDRLDQVRTAEKSLLEISELQSTLATSLQTQQAHIEQLVQDSFFAEENVGGGNKQLKKASERQSTAKLVFYGTCGLCVFVVGWDLVF